MQLRVVRVRIRRASEHRRNQARLTTNKRRLRWLSRSRHAAQFQMFRGCDERGQFAHPTLVLRQLTARFLVPLAIQPPELLESFNALGKARDILWVSLGHQPMT